MASPLGRYPERVASAALMRLKNKTLREIGEHHGISVERARQNCTRGIKVAEEYSERSGLPVEECLVHMANKKSLLDILEMTGEKHGG